MLLYVEGDFIQTIEGPENAVKSLYTKILVDKRHTRIMKVSEGFTENRQFEEWVMSGISLNYLDLSSIAGLEDYDRDRLFKKYDTNEHHPALKVMEAITPIVDKFGQL